MSDSQNEEEDEEEPAGWVSFPASLRQTRGPHEHMQRLLAQRKQRMQQPQVLSTEQLMRNREALRNGVSSLQRLRERLINSLECARKNRKLARETYLTSCDVHRRRNHILYGFRVREVCTTKRSLWTLQLEIQQNVEALADLELKLK